ncbi:MAG: hypothetical protein QM775_34155 [Pirellulales bacterium]
MTFEFDGFGLLRGEQDRNGNRVEFEYELGRDNGEGFRLASLTNQGGLTTEFHYRSDVGRELAAVTDPYGVVTRFQDGKVISSPPDLDNDATNDQSLQITAGVGLRFTNSAGAAVDDVEDPYVFSLLDAIENSDVALLAPAGNIGRLQSELPSGVSEATATFRRAYNSVTESEPEATKYQFNGFGLLTARAAPAVDGQVSGEGEVWQWDRNDDGQVIVARTPAGRGYTDGLGITLPSGGFDVVSYSYDEDGNLETVTYADETYDTYAYDAAKYHQVSSFTDRNGTVTTYVLDSRGNAEEKHVDPLGLDLTTKFTYTETPESLSDLAGGLLLTQTSAEGRVTTFEYYVDALTAADLAKFGRLKSKTYTQEEDESESSLVESYDYDLLGNLVSKTDVNNVRTAFRYDRLRQLVEQRLGGEVNTLTGELTGGILVALNTYDAAGNLKSTTVPSPDASTGYTTTLEYDFWNRLLKTTQPEAVGQHGAPITEYTYTADGLTETVKDARGHVTTYEYDARRRVVEITESGSSDGVVARSGGSAYTGATSSQTAYDAADRVKSTTDALGHTTYFTYDELGRSIRTQSPDPDGGGSLTAPVTRIERDDEARTVAEYSPNPSGSGEVYVRKYFDKAGRLIRVQQPQLVMPAGIPEHAESEYFKITTYEYYDDGKLKTERTGLSFIDEPENADALNADGSIDSEESSDHDVVQNTVSYTYDFFGRLKSTSVNAFNSTAGIATTSKSYALETVGGKEVLVVRETSADLQYEVLANLGDDTPFQTVTTYDEFGRVAQIRGVDPDKKLLTNGALASSLTKYEYFADGRLKRTIETYVGGESDPNNQITSYTYDELGRKRTTTSNGTPVNYTYDELGRLLETRSAEGTSTTNIYNSAGQLTKTVSKEKQTDPEADPAEVTSTVYKYDQVGATYSSTVTGRTETKYEYDALDRQTSSRVTYLEGGGTPEARTTTYAANGMVAATSDGKVSTTYAYDAHGRTLSETGDELTPDTPPLPTRTTVRAYDDLALSESLTINDKNRTTWNFDGLGRVLAEQLLEKSGSVFTALSGVLTYAYDEIGNVVAYTDRNDREFVYFYDNVGRKTGETWLGDPDDYAETYTYDQWGRTASIANHEIEYTYLYDAQGRLSHSSIYGYVHNSIDIAYVYDSFDRLTSRAVAGYPETDVSYLTDFQYDEANRLTTATFSQYDSLNAVYYSLGAVGWTYGRDDLIETIQRGHFRTTFGYDDANHLTSILHVAAVDGPSEWEIAEFTYGDYDEFDRYTSYVGPDGERHYRYDSRGQLIEVTDDLSAMLESYAYDAEGNRTDSTSTEGLAVGDYENGAHDRLESDGTYDYEYDAQGNRLAKENIFTGEREEYIWDHRNRLTQVNFKDVARRHHENHCVRV